MAKTIQKDKLADFFKKLSEFEVYGPTQVDGIVFYRNMEANEPLLEFTNSQKPPKEVFFPQTEKMFDFEIEGTKIVDVKDVEPSQKPLLLFGIRPCDARAMRVLDKLFTWDYIDPYYVNRKERATIISLTCTGQETPLQNCFCTSVGGSPNATEGADMLWTDLGDSYFVESLTEKGNEILELGGALFKDPGKEDEKAAHEAKKKGEEAIVRGLETDGIAEALEESFESPYWEEFSRRCLGCGICTLLCPTCHCFDINDVLTGNKACRERSWDFCQHSYYSIHASGHNPRPEKKHRQRNRIYHKFLYSGKNLDLLGCVGCGRCITRCPVNIDIIEVVEGIKEDAGQGGDGA